MFSKSAEYYDAIYGTFKDYATESQAIATVVRGARPGAHSVLDVGCGTGEHAKHLRHSHGFAIDGLDLDPGLLAIARRKVPDAHFFEADMSDFDLERRYDVVMCLFSSIGYLKTLPRITEALQCFRRHLTEGGVVIVEPWFPPGALRLGDGGVRHAEGDGLRIERTSHISVAGNLSTLIFNYRLEDATGVRTMEEIHELGLFTPDEMLASFKDAGLAATHDPVGLNDGRGLYTAHPA